MTRSTVVLTNGAQTVLLPKAVAFPDNVHQVEIIRQGHSRVISPVGRRWDAFFQDGPRTFEDFMCDRDQPAG